MKAKSAAKLAVSKKQAQVNARGPQVARVLALIESGLSIRAACKEVGINRVTFGLTVANLGAASQYAHARVTLAAYQIERLEATIEDMRAGVVDAQQAAVEINARKWIASKLLPKVYGDRAGEAAEPLNLKVGVVIVPAKEPTQPSNPAIKLNPGSVQRVEHGSSSMSPEVRRKLLALGSKK